jgi:hypothetical protein
MTKCYVDHKSDQNIKDFFVEKGFSVKAEDPPTSKITPGTLFFVHVNLHKQDKWITWAKEKLEVDVVFMRTDLTVLPDENSLPPNCHRCEYPAHKLGEYLQVKRFFEELDKGTKDFSLLKRSMFVFLTALAILCQGYLAVHAEYKEQDKDWKDQDISLSLEQMSWNSVDKSMIPASLGKKESTEKVRNPSWWWTVFERDFEDRKSLLAAVKKEWDESSDKEISKELEDLVKLIVAKKEVKPPKMVARVYLALVEKLGV